MCIIKKKKTCELNFVFFFLLRAEGHQSYLVKVIIQCFKLNKTKNASTKNIQESKKGQGEATGRLKCFPVFFLFIKL